MSFALRLSAVASLVSLALRPSLLTPSVYAVSPAPFALLAVFLLPVSPLAVVVVASVLFIVSLV